MTMISGCCAVLCIIVAHLTCLIGAHAKKNLYTTGVFKYANHESKVLHLATDHCTISYEDTEFVCQTGVAAKKKGIAQKQNGEWVSFNCLTRWLKCRNARQVINAGKGVLMTVSKDRAVFLDSATGNEAFFTLGPIVEAKANAEISETDNLQSSLSGGRVQYHVHAAETLEGLHAAPGWNTVSFDRSSWRLDPRDNSCPSGLALMPNSNGLRWTLFGRFSFCKKRKAVAFICLTKDIKLKENKGLAELSVKDTSEKAFLPLESRPVSIGVEDSAPSYFYIRYRPNGDTKAEPGILQLPVGAKCLVTKDQDGWHCTASPDVNMGRQKGLSLRANPDTAYGLLNPITERKNRQPYGPATYIYAGNGVKLTTTLYVPFTARKATFRHKDTKETAVFYLGDVTPVFPAEEADVERTAFAKRLMDTGDYFKLRFYSTEHDYEDVRVTAATGAIDFDDRLIYSAVVPQKQGAGIAIFEPVETAFKSRVAYFKGDRPLQATAVVYAGPNVKISQRDGKVYFTVQEGTKRTVYVKIGDGEVKLNEQSRMTCKVSLDFKGTRHCPSKPNVPHANQEHKFTFQQAVGHPVLMQFVIIDNAWAMDYRTQMIIANEDYLVVTATGHRLQNVFTLHLSKKRQQDIPASGVMAVLGVEPGGVISPGDKSPSYGLRLEMQQGDAVYVLETDSRTAYETTCHRVARG